jgi:hypothetical protein
VSAKLLLHPLSPESRDVLLALAASELAASLQDSDSRCELQKAALEGAARIIERMLCAQRC